MRHLTRAALLSAFALLALTSCETVEGFKRDTGKLWASLQPAPGSATAPGQTAPSDDGSLVAPVASDCPVITIMPELKTLSEFTDITKPSDKTKISEFTLVGVQSKCQQHAAAMAMHIELIFSGKIGPKGRANKSDKPTFSYPYFIAVTDAKGAVVAKEVFAANVAYKAGESESKQIESITQNLPIKSTDQMADYKVLVGFQLDDAQLAYNRTKAQ